MDLRDLFPYLYEARSVPKPAKPVRGCTCIARADADDTMPGNISGGRPLFTLVEITAANCVIASREAKRQATEKLGMKPKHLKVRCVGK